MAQQEMSREETGDLTGTTDKDYNILWFTESALSNVVRLEVYIRDAERQGDTDLVEFFTRARDASLRGAAEGKKLLAARLAQS